MTFRYGLRLPCLLFPSKADLSHYGLEGELSRSLGRTVRTSRSVNAGLLATYLPHGRRRFPRLLSTIPALTSLAVCGMKTLDGLGSGGTAPQAGTDLTSRAETQG